MENKMRECGRQDLRAPGAEGQELVAEQERMVRMGEDVAGHLRVVADLVQDQH